MTWNRATPGDRAHSLASEESFRPHCCPNPGCLTRVGADFDWIDWGWHKRKKAPFRVKRFLCKVCGRSFSTQTFRFTYWQKRPELDRTVLMSGRGCMSNRQIAQLCEDEPSHTTIGHKVERLARQAIRFTTRAFQTMEVRLGGRVLFDGLGSFEFSQYEPYWLNVAVHRESAFVLGFTDSPLRRSGTMRPQQRRKRSRLEERFGRPARRSIRRGTARLLQSIKPFLDPEVVEFGSDEHPAYPGTLADAGLADRPHHTFPGSAMRTHANPLFEINLLDLKIRHGSSNQKRETIAFNKRRQAGLERAWLFAIWHNFMRPKRIRTRGATPAQLVGLAPRKLRYDDIFGARILNGESPIPPEWRRHLRRDVRTARFERNNANRRCYGI